MRNRTPEVAEEPSDSSKGTLDIIGQLERISSQIPSLTLDRARDSIYDTFLHNNENREKLKSFALGCASFTVDIYGPKSQSPVKSALKFVRNMLILDKLYGKLASSISIDKNDNYKIWKANTENTGVKYIPHRLLGDNFKAVNLRCNCLGRIFWTMMKDAVQNNGGIFSYPDTHGIWDTEKEQYPTKDIKIDYLSNFTFGTEVQEGTLLNTKSAAPLMIFHLTDHEHMPAAYIVIASHYMECAGGKKVLSVMPNAFILIDHSIYSGSDGWLADEASALIDFLDSYCAYHDFNPRTDTLSCHCSIVRTSVSLLGQEHYPIHVSQKFTELADSLKNVKSIGIGRGYAFVGYPGTGKSVMMRQLVQTMANNGCPVIYLGLEEILSPDHNAFDVNSILGKIYSDLKCIRTVGYDTVVMYCDDIDSYDLHTKNVNVDRLIKMFDYMRMFGTAGYRGYPRVIFMTTINNPSAIHGTLIKRSCRIDEVIKVDLPSAELLREMVEYTMVTSGGSTLKLATGRAMNRVFAYMEKQKLSIADAINVVSLVRVYKKEQQSSIVSASELKDAVKRMMESKENANADYDSPDA